ncbi:DMT family transporter [Nakamurella antarctica]|uniref:DMT family transporter n=1 Tax=Nakamurella antarctica TaxID=1902245 RepID=A0A3G8ZHZ9_9ACTN|nr:DMT family transporter [Nakamurella antarctica]AZI56820.1 DMT family transporter [Nakamurella antarctica]
MSGPAAGLKDAGVRAALLAAVLFGVGTPLAKLLLDNVSPWLLAGLLYTGSGVGLGLWRLVCRKPKAHLAQADRLPLAGAVLFGGVIGPVLLLIGLTHLPATGASLLLNAEGVFTAVLAWVVFKENVDRWVALGMLVIVAGAVVLVVPAGVELGSPWPSIAVLGACLAWGIDNNLTRKVALTDASWLAAVKGLIAGPTNLILAFVLGARLPPLLNIAASMTVGFLAYGVSLVLFIVGLRHVGTARAGAYFSIAPFFGAALAVLLGDQVTVPLLVAGLLMAVGIWLHLRERHEHAHTHELLVHEHFHTHDDGHHDHPHRVGGGEPASGPGHRHLHTHEPQTHTHQHFPDSHHRHAH